MPPFPLTANYCTSTVSLALSFSIGPPCLVIVVIVQVPPRSAMHCALQIVCGGLASRLRHRRKHPVVSAVAYHTLRGKCASGQTGVPTPLLSSFGQPVALSLLYFAWAFLLLFVCLPWFCASVSARKSPRHVQYINHRIISQLTRRARERRG